MLPKTETARRQWHVGAWRDAGFLRQFSPYEVVARFAYLLTELAADVVAGDTYEHDGQFWSGILWTIRRAYERLPPYEFEHTVGGLLASLETALGTTLKPPEDDED